MSASTPNKVFAIDGVVRPSKHVGRPVKSSKVLIKSVPTTPAPVKRARTPVAVQQVASQKKKSKSFSFLNIIRYASVTSILFMMALFTNFPYIVLLAIGIYGILAIILRIKSMHTFALAMTALGFVALLHVIRPQATALSENIAIDALALLIIGIISVILELRREAKVEVQPDKAPKFRINP